MSDDPEVAIVGGGPVGLITAILAARSGLDVTVVEPRTTPIDKACGEGLMPGAVDLLQRLDIHPDGAELAGIAYVQGDARAEHAFVRGRGRGVARTALHAALAARAAEHGVRLVRARVDGIEQDPRGVTARLGDDSRLRSRWLIGCDGLHSRVRGWAGLAGRAASAGHRRYGLRRHYAVAPWSNLVEVHWTPRAELYITPLGPELTGVAMLGPRGADFTREIAASGDLAERLGIAGTLGGTALSPATLGAGPLLQRTHARTQGRVLLVGDASGYVDALTGEGLRLGFAQADAAVRAIVAGDTRAYEREWVRITRDFRMLTSGLVAAANSPLRSRVVPTAVRLPRLYGGIVERLSR